MKFSILFLLVLSFSESKAEETSCIDFFKNMNSLTSLQRLHAVDTKKTFALNDLKIVDVSSAWMTKKIKGRKKDVEFIKISFKCPGYEKSSPIEIYYPISSKIWALGLKEGEQISVRFFIRDYAFHFDNKIPIKGMSVK